MSPDDPLKCLLVQPRFSANNFWNYVEIARGIGAKTPAPPLGLLTVAALLPKCWTLKLVDLNVREITAQEWEEADLICVGGMLTQQPG
ncbi:MAG: B12-binding domain-containing radical SAM protein, partial [Planctomycetota bacterium]